MDGRENKVYGLKFKLRKKINVEVSPALDLK